MSLVINFLNLSISLLSLGKTWINNLVADLFNAGRSNSYLETFSNKADTLHKYISYSDERSIKRAYEKIIREVLKKLKLKRVVLAIDGKKDLYYGKNGGINTRKIKSERGADEAWEYVVLSIVEPITMPLMAVRYHQGADLAKLSIELLEFAQSLPIKIDMVLFDRGFYNGHLIDYLESMRRKGRFNYLMLVPQNKKIKEFVDKTKNKKGCYIHEIKYNREKSYWRIKTKIVVYREVGFDKNGKPYDMVFATNLKNPINLVSQYKKRWNIETGFRVMEEGKIKTKSNNPLIRLFYFLLRALLTVVWVLNKIKGIKITFKAFLNYVEKKLGYFQVYKPPPKPIFF